MLARRRTLQHPKGSLIELPKLVPSFSSKGFPFYKDREDRKERSDSARALELIGPFLEDSFLVSAYDLHHHHLGRVDSHFQRASLVFIDSGGYELSSEYDSTEPSHGQYTPKRFTEEDYTKVLRKLPQKPDYVIPNYDWGARRKKLREQVLSAKSLFRDFPKALSCFIVKPSGNAKYLCVPDIINQAPSFRGFGVLGVTEKELGSDLKQKLLALAKLRDALDRESIDIPIHVWGGLDPVLTPLYFFAGAELFDGVSWLRYAYHDGVSIYKDSVAVLDDRLGVETPRQHLWGLILNQNIVALQQLTTALKSFADGDGRDFSMFGPNEQPLKRAYQELSTRIPEMRNNG